MSATVATWTRTCVPSYEGSRFPFSASTDLFEVDGRLPKLVLSFVKVPHSNFAEVARMISVEVCSVMVLATCHTATTRMLSVLAYTTMAGRHMAATAEKEMSATLETRAAPRMRTADYAMIRLTVFSSSSGE
jgi:hypothetical protein